MTKLVRIIARIDGVTESQIRSSVTKRAPEFDLAVILSFGMLYTLAAYFVVGWLLARHSKDGGGSVTAIMAVYACAVLSAAGALFADLWSLALESVRLGSGHLSDRTYRIPWARHRLALFIAVVLVFWIVAAFRYAGQFRQARST